MEGQKEYRRKVTLMQMKSKDDLENNEVYKISKKVRSFSEFDFFKLLVYHLILLYYYFAAKVSDLLAAREKAKKLQDAIEKGEINEAEQTMEQRKLMSMSRKVQTLLKAKTTLTEVASG
jgi:hypothetical protein